MHSLRNILRQCCIRRTYTFKGIAWRGSPTNSIREHRVSFLLMLDDFLLFPSFFPSPRTTRHHWSIIVHFRFASFSIRAPVSGTWPNNALTSQRKIERAGGMKITVHRGSRARDAQHSTPLAMRRGKRSRARYHWNTLERKKERGAHRGKLICQEALSTPPSPTTLGREKIDTVTLRDVNCRERRSVTLFATSSPFERIFFFSLLCMFLFSSFFSFFLSFTKEKFGTVNMCHVSLQVTEWKERREKKYICICVYARETRRILLEEFRVGYVRRNSWEFVRRVTIVGIKFPLKIVSSKARLQVIEF